MTLERAGKAAMLVMHIALATLRYSLLTGAATLVLSSIGVGKYLISTLDAIDMRVAGQTVDSRAGAEIVVVAISDAGYQRYFGGTSPLKRDRLADLLATISSGAPHAKRLVVDLDLAPDADAQGAAKLEAQLRRGADRWVIASAAPMTPAEAPGRDAWRTRLCAAGVSFASPMLPTDFGYVSPTQQFRHSLADVAARQEHHCEAPAQALEMRASTLSPHELKSGIVLPFDGDLEQLQAALSALDPAWVLIGGNWGHDDMFLTPFGDRFGLQVHAAALAGRLLQERQAPYLMQVVVSWFFVTLISLTAGRLNRALRAAVRAQDFALPGHGFFDNVVRPAALLALVLGSAAAMAVGLAWLWGRTGLWIPSSMTVLVLLSTVVLSWNWGRNDIPSEGKLAKAWQTRFASPVLHELQVLRSAWAAWRGTERGEPWGQMPAARILFELLMVSASLAFQTVLPVIALLLTVFKSL